VSRSDDVATTGLLERLKAGETASQIREALGLGPAEYLKSLGHAAFGSDSDDDGPDLIQRAPRRPWLAPALRETAWADAFPGTPRPVRLAAAAALLQVHDFWDASHQAAQEADDLGESRFSAYWHGIAHRREPDPGNAAYWFRRVGRHPLFSDMAGQARPILEANGNPALTGQMLAGNLWNPPAFITFCTSARRGTTEAVLALRLQRIEMTALLEATLNAL
jgi:hypothetical protein